MHPVIAALTRHAAGQPAHPALSSGAFELGYRAVLEAVTGTAETLRLAGARTAAIALDNSPAWAVADLASLAAPFVCVPIPQFFSSAQRRHVILDAGADCLLTDRPACYAPWLEEAGIDATREPDLVVAGSAIARFSLRGIPTAALPAHTAKVTYTSGTTGTPKGVCLSGAALAEVAASIATFCRLSSMDRHASLLPLATLLENVCGVYASLLAGATCMLAPLAAGGMIGSARVERARMLDALASGRATTTIMTPQMLLAAMEQVALGQPRPRTLRLLAVGGAPLHRTHLERALALGLPAYEGYGLSECASVVTLNGPGCARAGSVGRALPHAKITIAEDGEILVSGATALGYVGAPAERAAAWRTGDLGDIDRDGFLHLSGRKRNIFVTSFGRNVAPEWVEAELNAAPEIAQAWVWGEARPWNAAVIAAAPGQRSYDVARAVERANGALPDYARIRAWIAAECDFSFANGELTANGRLRRDVLLRHYRSRLDRLYEEVPDVVL
jgi:long-subunit acyl-CoA synthetase (AMP-forming)